MQEAICSSADLNNTVLAVQRRLQPSSQCSLVHSRSVHLQQRLTLPTFLYHCSQLDPHPGRHEEDVSHTHPLDGARLGVHRCCTGASEDEQDGGAGQGREGSSLPERHEDLVDLKLVKGRGVGGGEGVHRCAVENVGRALGWWREEAGIKYVGNGETKRRGLV